MILVICKQNMSKGFVPYIFYDNAWGMLNDALFSYNLMILVCLGSNKNPIKIVCYACALMNYLAGVTLKRRWPWRAFNSEEKKMIVEGVHIMLKTAKAIWSLHCRITQVEWCDIFFLNERNGENWRWTRWRCEWRGLTWIDESRLVLLRKRTFADAR